MNSSTMTTDAEYLNNLNAVDAHYRELFAAQEIDFQTKRTALRAAHHAQRAALLADYRAKEEAK